MELRGRSCRTVYNHREEKGRGETGGVYLRRPLSWSVHHNFAREWKGEGVHTPPSSGWAEFTIIMKCTPESGHGITCLLLISRLCVQLCDMYPIGDTQLTCNQWRSILIDRQKTVCFFRLFICEGDMEFWKRCRWTCFALWWNLKRAYPTQDLSKNAQLQADVNYSYPLFFTFCDVDRQCQAMSELCVEPLLYGEQPNAVARQLNLCYIFI
jgi:hypothetical protein